MCDKYEVWKCIATKSKTLSLIHLFLSESKVLSFWYFKGNIYWRNPALKLHNQWKEWIYYSICFFEFAFFCTGFEKIWQIWNLRYRVKTVIKCLNQSVLLLVFRQNKSKRWNLCSLHLHEHIQMCDITLILCRILNLNQFFKAFKLRLNFESFKI